MIRTKEITLAQYGSYGRKTLHFEMYRNLSNLEDGIRSKPPSKVMSHDDFFANAHGRRDFH